MCNGKEKDFEVLVWKGLDGDPKLHLVVIEKGDMVVVVVMVMMVVEEELLKTLRGRYT